MAELLSWDLPLLIALADALTFGYCLAEKRRWRRCRLIVSALSERMQDSPDGRLDPIQVLNILWQYQDLPAHTLRRIPVE